VKHSNRITLAAALGALLALTAPAPFAAEEAAPPQPVTTADPDIPVDELALLLKPLTKDELLVEADGWQSLVKEQAEEIAQAEIAVKRQNREIEKAKEVGEKAEEVKEQLAVVKRKAEEAEASGDTEAAEEAEQAAEAAQETMREIGDTVEEAAAAAEQTAEAKGERSEETRAGLDEAAEAADRATEAVDRVQESVEDAGSTGVKSAKEAVDVVQEATRDAQQATDEVREKAETAVRTGGGTDEQVQGMDSAAQAMAEAKQEKEQEKLDLLEQVNTLREARTQLLDRLKAVIVELETKTDQEDADTLAMIQDYRLYMGSVTGITLDVKDTTSAWVAVKGWLTSDEGGLRWARNIALFLGILLAAWILSKLFSRAVHRGLRMTGRASKLLENFLVGSVRWVVMAVGVIMALAALEVSIGPLLAVLGAAGFVIAFALQDSLSNFASGLMILFFRPFDVGDVVDAGGVSGKVTSMNLVSTTIKTFDNKDMVVPNNKIWSDVITNATAVDTRRVDMEFGIGYGDDIDRAQAILEEIVSAHPKALKDPPPTIRMNTLADSSVNFICRPWAKTADYWDVYWDVTKAVKQRFDAEGIGIPFPQRDVHLYIEGGAGKESMPELAKGGTGSRGANPQPLELDDKEQPEGG
jgi:small conductance mechanosensitive channel